MPSKAHVPTWLPTAAVTLVAYLVVLYARSAGLINDYWFLVIEQMALFAILGLGLNLIYGFNGQFSLGQIGFYAIGAYGSALITKDYAINWSGTRTGTLAWVIAGQVGLTVAIVLISWLRLGTLRARMANWLRSYLRSYELWILPTAIVLTVVAAALVVGGGAAWALAQGLRWLFDALLLPMPQSLAREIVFFLALINGATMAGIVAYLVGLPLLRLGSDYFGIATLGFSIMVYTALLSSDLVIPTMKGARGMVEIPVMSTWTWVLGALVVVVIVMRNLVYSSWGRAIISVREDEIAAKTMGIDVAHAKTVAFTVGGLFAGVAGGLYAHLFGSLFPANFDFIKGFDPLVIIVLGGLGSITGTVVASGLYMLIIEGLRVLLPQGQEDKRFVIYALILLLVMLLRKQGLLGTTEWGWLRAPMTPLREVPTPERSVPTKPTAE
jgi:branched-chain amino acid transport system permease protein